MNLLRKTAYYFLLSAVWLCCTPLMAQTIAPALLSSADLSFQEKLFVHTDKAFYVAGEIIWFKVYATDAHLNRPADLSKIAYVELLNKDHKPSLQAKIALVNGSGNGSFQLPYSVNSGNYLLRAYTNWMKNAGPELFFEKDLMVVNTLKKPEWLPAVPVTYDVQFFPEGGNLVTGIQSKLGFRIMDSQGKSVDAQGVVVNQRDDTVARFSAFRFGLGQFELLPKAGEQYRSIIQLKDGPRLTNALPASLATGLVMQLKETDNEHLVIIVRGNGTTVSLAGATRGQRRFSMTQALVNGKAEFVIDKKQLGEGISQLTVLDANTRPVSERLYWKRPEVLMVSAALGAAGYGLRKKVTLDLSTRGGNAQAVQGDLSVAVYRLDSLQAPEPADIASYLWLQSELKGNIESPAFYFSKDPAAGEAMDNLLLTQGWRRFRTDVTALGSGSMEFLPETEGHLINGKLVNKRNGQPVENIGAYLSVPAERPLFNNAVSGKNGAIRFNVKNFYGGNELVLQPTSLADSMYRVDIASPFSEKYSRRNIPDFWIPDAYGSLLAAHGLQAQVGNTYYADKHRQFLFPAAIDTTPFYGIPDKRYYLDDYTRFITMEEVMREYVGDVRVRKNNEQFSYRVRNTDFETFMETDPLVLIDGVPVYDASKIIAFDPLKIRRTDVMARKFYQNSLVHDGIVSYTTYTGDLAGFPLDANALIVEYEGLQLQREFYSPVYETAAQVGSRLPDFRNVLYWSPDVRTNARGTQQLSFYTADLPGKYAVVIQGITANGLAGSTVSTFTVNK
ncbi:MAG: hypothetical protein JWQ78_392 [Sediminibacterium sp.]|nr:hypothetical protein [Sediminibacterium sp.]